MPHSDRCLEGDQTWMLSSGHSPHGIFWDKGHIWCKEPWHTDPPKLAQPLPVHRPILMVEDRMPEISVTSSLVTVDPWWSCHSESLASSILCVVWISNYLLNSSLVLVMDLKNRIPVIIKLATDNRQSQNITILTSSLLWHLCSPLSPGDRWAPGHISDMQCDNPPHTRHCSI